MRRLCRVALQLRLASRCSSSVAGPSRSMVDHPQRRDTVSIRLSAEDEKLIQRSEFYGVAATSGRREDTVQPPDLALSRMHEHLRNNYRVNPESVMVDLVRRLEKGDAALISLLKRAPDRWIPMSIRCCGRALSSIPIESRRVIVDRLWKQIEKKKLPVSIESINALLRVKLDNNEAFGVTETLADIDKRGLIPDQETFHLLLEKTSYRGNYGKFKDLVSEDKDILRDLSHRGHVMDAISHSHGVHSTAIRMLDKIVDSMIEEALTKYGTEGEALSLGAACVAAAAKGKIDRLRELLRRSVDEDLRLRLPIESAFEIIWRLSEKAGDKEMRNEAVIEEILNRVQHPRGFFKFLYREVDRHISASHFHTAMVLIEETMRVRDSLRNQERNVFLEQLVGRMCRAMVKSKMEHGLMLKMASRMETKLQIERRFIRDELMLATLTLKDYDSEERFASFCSLLTIVDPYKERPHLILPLLVQTPLTTSDAQDRLKLIYRVSSLGYSNLELLDSNLMANYLFQPMYKNQEKMASKMDPPSNVNVMERITNTIHSFGVPKATVWHMMNGWWKMRKEEEKGAALEWRVTPYADEIQNWLRSSYAPIFNGRETTPLLPLSKTRLENAIEKGDSSTILSLLSSHGWPAEADLSAYAPRILKLLLDDQSNENIMKWLRALSREAAGRQDGEEMEQKTPLDSSHMLKVLRHRVNETRPPTNELIEMALELKRLFPNAVFNQDSYLDTISETNRLIAACFIFKEGTQLTMEGVEGIIDLLSTLIKLNIVYLASHGETVTPYCVHKVLQRFGWNSAVKLWLRFQSSFSFGNGMAILLAYTLRQNTEEQAERNIQYVTHKAPACHPPSRIHALYAAALVNTDRPGRLEEKAVEYFKQHGSEMTPFDCALAYRLTNAIKYPKADEYFIRTFPALCLAHTRLGEKKEIEARNMLHSALKFCEARRLASLKVEMCDLFAQYGVSADEKEKGRVESTIEEHQRLLNRWIFSPEGFIQANSDDEFIKEDEWRKFMRKQSSV